jgi:hypothetical protein
VVLPARLRAGAQWSDACILNISSRGLMIHSARAGPKDNVVELRRGEHVIIARVVWSDGARVGLQACDRVPLEEIVSADRAPLPAPVDGRFVERRRSPRYADPRLRGRAIEFIATLAVAASLATGGWLMAEEAFARPLALVATALG